MVSTPDGVEVWDHEVLAEARAAGARAADIVGVAGMVGADLVL